MKTTLATALVLLVLTGYQNREGQPMHAENTNETMEAIQAHQTITTLTNKLFIYTDEQEWEKLHNEVFTEQVWLDMTSLGGAASQLKATEITAMWTEGFQGLDAVNHLGGNYLIDIQGDEAKIYAYATATHYKKDATQGTTREFVGTYDLHAVLQNGAWRIDSFQYNLKYMTGNLELK